MEQGSEKTKILIVDDNLNNVFSFQAILKAPEIELLTATSGEEALQRLLDHPDVSLIVMDVQMPGMDGFETSELIRAYPKFQDIPILFVTAVYRSDVFARRGFRSGASDYITKPVDNEILESKVNVFLTLQNQKRRLAREIEARSEAEARVRHLNTVLRAIRNVNQLIVRERDPARLVQQTCDCLIETRGFQSAWIALLDDGGSTSLAVEAGVGQTFTPIARAMEGGGLPPCGRQALEQAQEKAFEVAPEVCTGCTVAADCSPRTRMVSRLEHGNQIYGLLAVSFPAGIAANSQEKELLTEVAADLAFALHNVEQEVGRQQAEKALVQAERLSLMGRIAASLAHEINNPIQAVVGCLGLARELVSENEDADRYMEVAIRELRRAARIVHQMRDLGRRPLGLKEPGDAAELIETVLTLTRNRAQGQKVRIRFERKEALSPVPMERDHVQQVFLNLVLNAIDAMPHGGELCIRAANTEGPPGVQLSFADTGVGIADKDLERIFDAFHSTKELGLGLGLYVSRNIVQGHGGWIDVQSQVGRGTTFTVWLPAEEPAGQGS